MSFRRRGTRIVLALVAVLAVAVTILQLAGLLAHRRDTWLVCLMTWVAAIGSILGIHANAHSAVKGLRAGNRGAAGPIRYQLTDAGFTARSLGAETSAEWENIIEVYESREFFLFYFSAAWAQMLPVRVVPEESRAAFRDALRLWVDARAHLLA